MLKAKSLMLAVAAVAIAAAGMAGAAERDANKSTRPAAQQQAGTIDRFEFVGGETGWQLAQHKYEVRGGTFQHSAQCDHAIRTAAAPTQKELEAAKRLYPGG